MGPQWVRLITSDHDWCKYGGATMVGTEANEDRTRKGREHPVSTARAATWQSARRLKGFGSGQGRRGLSRNGRRWAWDGVP